MEYLYDYLLFLGKSATVIIAVFIIVGIIVSSIGHAKELAADAGSSISVKKLNDRFDRMRETLQDKLLSGHELKALRKKEAADEKAKTKAAKKTKTDEETKPRTFVLDFNGDIRASAGENLREEITALLTVATEKDTVVVRLESPGGTVHGYGLAASQLQRIRDRNIKLVIAVDKVAASGGYMMACVADEIIAAPFAIIGSIGVLMQLPNFHKLLQKHDVNFEQITAGEYKRTLTVFGENTDEDREKTREDLEEVHVLFKNFISQYRPDLDIAKVATGEHWHATQALDLGLVDKLQTSDDYLLNASNSESLYLIKNKTKKSLGKKLGMAARSAVDQLLVKTPV